MRYRNLWLETARRAKEVRRRDRDERVNRRCACKQHAAMGRRGVFCIDASGISHSTVECYVFMTGPQRRRRAP